MTFTYLTEDERNELNSIESQIDKEIAGIKRQQLQYYKNLFEKHIKKINSWLDEFDYDLIEDSVDIEHFTYFFRSCSNDIENFHKGLRAHFENKNQKE